MKLLGLIKQMEEERRQAKRVPSHILFTYLLSRSEMTRKELSIELNRLFREGKIEVGHTINDRWIKAI